MIWLIRRYQIGGGGLALNVDCNFEPSCSNYALECLKKFQLIRALRLIFNRISRCNERDLVEKKIDPVPDQ